jgi:hypothetical protein
MADDMVHAMSQGNLDGIVLATVVNDQPLHLVETSDFAGQGREGNAQCLGFVVAGDLDDEFQFIAPGLACSLNLILSIRTCCINRVSAGLNQWLEDPPGVWVDSVGVVIVEMLLKEAAHRMHFFYQRRRKLS